MRYLPARKFIFRILLITLAAAVVFWFFFLRQAQKSEITYQKSPPAQLNRYLNKDSDNDGLKDWEEILWKTNPSDPDTDKDGTPDGEEVKENRNPVKPGPDDELKNEARARDQEASKENLTQRIGREFLSQYLYLKQFGDLNEEQKNLLVNSMIEKLTSELPKNKYDLRDLKILPNNSKENTKNYINKLGEIFKSFDRIEKREADIITEILVNENEEYPDKIEELKKNRIIYEKAENATLLLQVPSNYKDIHLGFLNHFNATAESISKMELIYKDPAQSMMGIQIYIREAERLFQIFKDFKKQFYKDNVKISPDEEGYIFVKEYFSKI